MSARAYVSEIGPFAVRERDDVLAGHTVVARNRPLVCRWPEGRAPIGLVVFCHGLGSSGGEYARLSGHWAQHGYLVIHPTFADAIDIVARAEPRLGLDPASDLSGWTAMPDVRTRMHEILHAPASWLGRIELVHVVMAALDDIGTETVGAERGGTSLAKLPCAIAGHSFGAYTAQLLAGAEIDLPDGETGRFRDARFSAAMLLSAQGRDQQGLREGSWERMTGPVLTVTGTLDRGAKGGDWRWKSEPYELAPAGRKYLMVLDDGDHFLGGFSEGPRQRQVPAQQEAVRQATLAFLDATLAKRTAARLWLDAIADDIAGCPVVFKRK